MEVLQADILIIGAGGAGLLAALHAHEKNRRLKIVIAVKGLLGQSGCTRMVQGGYNAVLNPADSLERHFEDTLKGGAFLNNQELAWILVEDAPKRIIELENKVGCLFDRREDGTIHQKPFAGQSFDRTVHKGDLTGIEIMTNLRDYILEHDIQVLEECRGLDFLRTHSRVTGAVLLDMSAGRMIAVRATATLVCTGGGATMYRISSPSLEKSGDGMAMACRAGAELLDMEMMQFHPTGLLVGRSMATGGLLEEGLRGAGARLFNGLGERFMERYDPEKKERATRDVVSRSSYLEITAGRGTDAGGVLLDASHLGEKFLLENFPGMVERCRDYGFDLLHGPVEVSPSAHYQMGGIRIDSLCHTNLDGLFAAGEDAGGVHGANRLGGNGVADSVVFGARAGDAMVEYASTTAPGEISLSKAQEIGDRWSEFLRQDRAESIFDLRQVLEDLMWENVGVVRDAKGLSSAVSSLVALRERVRLAAAGAVRECNAAWNEAINVTNLTLLAEVIARSALIREESRGAHFRSDFSKADPRWLKNICAQRRNGDLEFTFRPVVFSRLKPPL